MSEVFVIDHLGDPGSGAAAVRCGDNLLMYLSPSLPRSALRAVADHLRRKLFEAGGHAAAASLGLDEALRLAEAEADRDASRSRVPAMADVAAATGLGLFPWGSDTPLFEFTVDEPSYDDQSLYTQIPHQLLDHESWLTEMM